jgi:predicted SAM-dependent methyltransferase
MIKDFLNNVFNKKIKLHVGCGTNYKDGWINIDNNSDNNIKKLDINHDLSKGLPLDDYTVDFIYNEHFIEHLSRENGLIFLKECYRVLKVGGVLRIACPDLDELIKSYLNDTWRELDWVKTYNCEWIESGCQMINVCLNEFPWGHKYVYNKEELKKRLIDAGFLIENINEASFSKSQYQELINIDIRIDSMIFDVRK